MVYILGCDHYLQEYELQDWQDEIRKIERQLKEKFYSVTEKIIFASKSASWASIQLGPRAGNLRWE
jgi:hypothetical protein